MLNHAKLSKAIDCLEGRSVGSRDSSITHVAVMKMKNMSGAVQGVPEHTDGFVAFSSGFWAHPVSYQNGGWSYTGRPVKLSTLPSEVKQSDVM